MTVDRVGQIRARLDVYRAAFNDMTKPREQWCDDVAGTAIDVTQDVAWLLDERDRLTVLVRKLDCVLRNQNERSSTNAAVARELIDQALRREKP